jgi:hypothetical protein
LFLSDERLLTSFLTDFVTERTDWTATANVAPAMKITRTMAKPFFSFSEMKVDVNTRLDSRID